MTDRDPTYEPSLARLISRYVDEIPERQPPRLMELSQRTGGRTSLVVTAAVVVAAVVLVTSFALVRSSPTGVAGRAPASACSSLEWPSTAISCLAAYHIGSQADARVDRARIWLTTLGDARKQMDWPHQVAEPSATAPVWVIVYDGRWTCCANAYDVDGRLVPQRDQVQWLVVADATEEGAGFIFIGDWSGKAVPETLPASSPG